MLPNNPLLSEHSVYPVSAPRILEIEFLLVVKKIYIDFTVAWFFSLTSFHKCHPSICTQKKKKSLSKTNTHAQAPLKCSFSVHIHLLISCSNNSNAPPSFSEKILKKDSNFVVGCLWILGV
ncbi:hypothetical protein Hanom_Chr03g00212321 [Helianthus anomalus]